MSNQDKTLWRDWTNYFILLFLKVYDLNYLCDEVIYSWNVAHLMTSSFFFKSELANIATASLDLDKNSWYLTKATF